MSLSNEVPVSQHAHELDAAILSAKDTLARNERDHGKVSRQVADTMCILGDLYTRKGDTAEAERCLKFARDIYVGTVRPDATELLDVQARLAELSINR